MVEGEIERNAGREIIMNKQAGETAFFGEVTGESVKLVIERGEIPDGEPAGAGGTDQAAGAATAADDPLDQCVRGISDINPVIVDLGTIGGRAPKLSALVRAVAVDD
jgi:hypothetical protein